MANEISKIKLPNNVTYNITVDGLGAAAYKGTTTSVTSGSSDLVTSGAVYTAIDNLPEPMIFKGSLGTGGTITTLPTASSANEGFTYKVITAGTYASQAAKVGDLFISNGTDWIHIPSGDEPSGTVTSVAISNGGGLSVSGSPITSSGTITISHADTSSQASVDNSGRTYIQDITLDTYGHVTKITSATETVVNTDRYVNSAAFANDASGVKMTLTRAGSDTATVTGTIPLVSSSTAGVAPKGAAVSSQSQSTKFLREDGSWAAPSYTTNTNTTYTLGTNGNTVTLTPSSGTTQSITVPYATYASSATTVTRTETNPTQYTTYNLIWNTGSTGLGWNDGLSYATLQGTTSVEGHAYLNVGNNIATGTTGNKTGVIRLYSEAGGYAAIKSNSTITGNVTVNIKTSGTVGAFTSAPTSGQVVITDGTDGGIKTLGYTIAKSVPSDAVFTDHYAWTDITGKPSSFTPASHTHGNIQNGGTLQTNDITIASGDKLVVTDSSDSNKVARTSISFDGSTTTKCLTQKGTWATFGTSNLALGTTASTALKGDTKYAGASTAGGSATSAAKLDTSTAGSATQPCYFANGVPSACTYSLNKTVPSDAVFTDTNNAVTQTATTTSANYELLFSGTADNTTRTEGARKTDSLKYNPSTKELTLDGTIVLNGYSRSTSTDPCPSLILKANNIDTDTAVTARTYSNSEINVHDKDGDRLGFMNWFKDADGSIGVALSAQNKAAGGGNYYNTLEMRVDKTGNRAYSISDAKAFRTAINTTTCSFTKSISSLAGATIVRRGNVVTLEFGHKISSAGSYTNIGTVSPAPIETLHFVVNIGGSWNLARINTSGVVSFNNAVSVAANAYLIGSCTYITAD